MKALNTNTDPPCFSIKIISSEKRSKTIVLPPISGPLGASERGASIVVAWIQIAAANAAVGLWRSVEGLVGWWRL
jgi:hypothetical protein